MRETRLIKNAIEKFDLNLNGITVLTEAASGYYMWTPIIAAICGAEVYAYAKDSDYGTKEEVIKTIYEFIRKEDIKINFISQNDSNILKNINIITNTGFLRPIDEELLKHTKDVVIPLMYETWEFRDTDIDLKYCYENSIPVLGTNEEDIRLKTMDYLAYVVMKVMLNMNLEVFNTDIVIAGEGKFADKIYENLILLADRCVVTNKESYYEIQKLQFTDALIIADHTTETDYVSSEGLYKPEDLMKINPGIKIIHIAGKINEKQIRESGLNLFPEKIAPLKSMSLRTDYAGIKPLIDLHAAGLKVGEIMYRNKILYKNFEDIIYNSLKDELCQDFSQEQKKFYKK